MNTDFSFLPRRSRTKAGLPSNFCFYVSRPSTFNFQLLPAFFRAISGNRPSRAEPENLIKLIRES